MACLLRQPALSGCRRFFTQNRFSTRNSQLSARLYSSDKKENLMPRNILREKDIATDQEEKGKVYDKRPFKFPLEANKKYLWCSCGRSKTQPFCDGSHKVDGFKVKLKPVVFAVAESGEYYLCNCKQTENRPFCDGTHKRQDIQDAIKY
ncbi:CDGSH iron-sulfur domain-containing protein 3, mitochondrial [Neocloeon triangulifer]|uniref:CDGSH iron-sulfur domain-containing protein 3, mitochondrial n=1 Tax=Neocloeon triangulifer TaxID=2078957 RepID=UPI00286F7362|nr:CDGSH iron-sulfur domain-containing protein 3, mitochondrial [Neocloeon triangulifer]